MATSNSSLSLPRVPCTICSGTFTARGLKCHMTRKHPSRQPTSQIPDNTNIFGILSRLKINRKTLKRIPKGAKISAAEALSTTITNCLNSENTDNWMNLFLFSFKSFPIPDKTTNGPSLTSKVKSNIDLDWNNFSWNENTNNHQIKNSDPKTSYAKRAISKLEDGDISGAVRILSSDESFAPFDSSTLESLRLKHPTASSQSFSPVPLSNLTTSPFQTCEEDVLKAIFSFPSGSAGGIDGLRPQYLKDMVGSQTGAAGCKLVKSLTELANTMLRGAILLALCPVLYGANLCALRKKDGGIRPIAIGNTFRRLVSKLCNTMLIPKTTSFLLPFQYGVGIKGGAESVVYSLRAFINDNSDNNFSILKIDLKIRLI